MNITDFGGVREVLTPAPQQSNTTIAAAKKIQLLVAASVSSVPTRGIVFLCLIAHGRTNIRSKPGRQASQKFCILPLAAKQICDHSRCGYNTIARSNLSIVATRDPVFF